MKKDLTIKTGEIMEIESPQVLQREGKAPVQRALLTLRLADGQILFLEMRDNIINRVKNIGLTTGDVVEVGLVFGGSQKGNNKFNNIFCNTIDYVK